MVALGYTREAHGVNLPERCCGSSGEGGNCATVVLVVLGEGNVAQEDVSMVVLVAIAVVAVVVDSAEIVQAEFAMAEAMAMEGIRRRRMMKVVKESCGAASDGCIIFFFWGGGEVGEHGKFESRIK